MIQARELVILDTLKLKDFVEMLGVLELTPEMEVDRMLAKDELDLAQLKELERAGYITSASDFAGHLAPDVHWIKPTEFGEAFDRELKA